MSVRRGGLLTLVVAVMSLFLLAASCDEAQNKAQLVGEAKARERDVYIPVNDVEFDNYNDRQRVADNPATILWCTFFPPTVGQEVFTTPITGKLTSGNKRPFPTEWRDNNANGYFAEKPGADAMFGSSGDYRYGFDPTRTVYQDFTDLGSYCTTEPKVWQKNHTRIVVEPAHDLLQLHNQARALLEQAKAVDDKIKELRKQTGLEVPDAGMAAKSAGLKAQAMAILVKAESK